MNRKVVTFAFTLASIGCALSGLSQHISPHGNKVWEAALTVSIIPGDAHTWGYDIFSGGKLYIHQPSVPGAPGNRGFKSRKNARAAAMLVCKKIQAHIAPPTVTPDELRKARLIP